MAGEEVVPKVKMAEEKRYGHNNNNVNKSFILKEPRFRRLQGWIKNSHHEIQTWDKLNLADSGSQNFSYFSAIQFQNYLPPYSLANTSVPQLTSYHKLLCSIPLCIRKV